MKKLSGILMMLSGMALTVASAWFGIHGLLIFFPEKDLYQGILFLGIALEIAKIFTAVFLFHYSKDSQIPRSIKLYMGMGVIVLVFISAFATYVHLSYNVADYIKQEDESSSKISRLNSELENNRKERDLIDKQIASLPTDVIKGRISLINKFDRRKKQIDAREEVILDKLNSTETKNDEVSVKKKEYAFLDYMSSSFGKSRQTIYNGLILLLVTVLDPLAIFLTLTGTYIFTSKSFQESIQENSKVVDKAEINDEIINSKSPQAEPIKESNEIKTNEEILEPVEEAIIPVIDNSVIDKSEIDPVVALNEDNKELIFKTGTLQYKN